MLQALRTLQRCKNTRQNGGLSTNRIMPLAVERAPKPTDDCLSGLAIFMNAVLLLVLTPVRARSQAAAICANSYFWSATRFLSGLTLIKRRFRRVELSGIVDQLLPSMLDQSI
jgi:hypothetical protein